MPKPEHWLKTPLRTFISLRNKIGHSKSFKKKKREKENQDWYLKKINSAESESENNR